MAASIEIVADRHPSRSSHAGRLFTVIAQTYATRVALGLVALASTIYVARLLGPEGRGFFAVATAITTIALQLGNLGLHASNTFHVARNGDLAPELVGNSLAIGALAGGGLGIITLLMAKLFPSIAPINGTLLVLAACFMPAALSYLLLQNLLIGMDEVRSYNVIELATKCISLAFIMLLAMCQWRSVEALFTASMLSVVIGAGWAAWRLRRLLTRSIHLSFRVFQKTLAVGLRAYWAALFSFLVLRIDLLMVKYMRGATDAGYYSISATMADYAGMLPLVIAAMLFPRLAGMARNRERLRLTAKVAAATAAATLPVVLVCGVFARPLVKLMFGSAFLPSAEAFVLLLPGMFFLSVEVVLVQFLNSIGFPIGVIIAWIVTCAINVGSNLWAIPRYGINGASVVSSITYCLAFLLVAVLTLLHRRDEISSVQKVVA